MATDPDTFPHLADRFSFVTGDAPIRTGVDGEDDLAWVRRLERIRDMTGAQYIVFHQPKLPSLEFVTDHVTVAIENMQRRKGFVSRSIVLVLDEFDRLRDPEDFIEQVQSVNEDLDGQIVLVRQQLFRAGRMSNSRFSATFP